MKRVISLLLAAVFCVHLVAAAKSEKTQKEKHQHKQKGSHKNSGDQPKKVRMAFSADYPAASNVVWRKYRRDYSATFLNGLLRSTAVYHANGQRRDTRTVVARHDLPGSILDRISRRDRITAVQFIQIERPATSEKIYRVLTAKNTTYYYDEFGYMVNYNY